MVNQPQSDATHTAHTTIKQQVWVRYVLLLAVFMIVLYVALRVFSVVAFGITAVDRYRVHHTADVLSCPITNLVDTSVSESPYVYPSPELVHRYTTNTQGPNLYSNADLQKFESDGYPSEFERKGAVEGVELTFKTENEERYLRSNVSKKLDSSAGTAWLPNFTAVQVHQSYHFKFSYRADISTTLSIQYKQADGKYAYDTFNAIAASASWKAVEGHFTVDNTDITDARLLIYPAGVGFVDVHELSLQQLRQHELPEGVVSIAFDDGWKSVYTTALPILEKYKLKTSQYIVPTFMLDSTTEYMSADQVRAMQQRGHEIGVHSSRHCDLTQMSPAQLAQDVELTKTKLASAGINVDKGFAYPFGAYSQETSDNLRNSYAYLRTSEEGLNDYYTDFTQIKVMSVEQSTTETDIQSWLTQARDNKQWLVLLYHRVGENGEYNISRDTFDKQIALIANSKLKTSTVAQALELLKR